MSFGPNTNELVRSWDVLIHIWALFLLAVSLQFTRCDALEPYSISQHPTRNIPILLSAIQLNVYQFTVITLLSTLLCSNVKTYKRIYTCIQSFQFSTRGQTNSWHMNIFHFWIFDFEFQHFARNCIQMLIRFFLYISISFSFQTTGAVGRHLLLASLCTHSR